MTEQPERPQETPDNSPGEPEDKEAEAKSAESDIEQEATTEAIPPEVETNRSGAAKPDPNSSTQNKSTSKREPGTLTSEQIAKQISEQLGAWMGDDSKDLAFKIEFALNSVVKLAGQGFESIKASIALLTDFLQDLSGIESFRIIPKASMSLEVDVRCKHDQEIVVKQPIAPFVELYALHLGERIRFEALVNKEKKGLQLDVHEGMSLVILAPLIGLQTVQIKGSALLTRDENGQLAIVVTTPVPGVDTPISITVPLKHFTKYAESEIKKKFRRE